MAHAGDIALHWLGRMMYILIYRMKATMSETAIAKVFMMGRSQAVRLPEAFRFSTDQVRIRTEGSRVILEPVESDWDWLHDLHAMGALDDDAISAAQEELPIQKRIELGLFK